MPPDEATCVRRLLNSIQCNDSTVISAKTTVLADPGKRGDFELAADFLLLAAPANKVNTSKGHRISALKRKRNGKPGSTGVEDRYYKRHEYVKLSTEQKKELREMRKKKSDDKPDDSKNNMLKSACISALEKQLEEKSNELEQQIAAVRSLQTQQQQQQQQQLPPPPSNQSPLQPPTALNQRGPP